MRGPGAIPVPNAVPFRAPFRMAPGVPMRVALCMLALIGALWLLTTAAPAEERARSLADIRAELNALGAEIGSLRDELRPSGSAAALGAGGALDRLQAVESELSRLTARTEELEIRIRRIVADGTNRLGDLEFRLVELEGGDISAIGRTAPLGGEAPSEAGPSSPSASPAPADDGPALAVGEQSAFDAAGALLAEGDWEAAADAFADFAEAYPAGPLTVQALIGRAEALQGMGETSRAARSWLAAFEAEPEGTRAGAALLGLGRALGDLGQVEEACIMLDEIGFRFPDSAEADTARAARREVGCQ